MRVFHFTKEKIAQLKAKANAEAKTHKISSLQATEDSSAVTLPDNYFGNAMQIGVVRMKAVELLEVSAETPVLFRLSGAIGGKALSTGSSPRFNVYGNDLGWGKPVAVALTFKFVFLMSYEILEAMGNDPEFMDAVTVD
ncbi:hypothetical protein AHAS_Ahas01G0097300 [Arachis hypogaea]